MNNLGAFTVSFWHNAAQNGAPGDSDGNVFDKGSSVSRGWSLRFYQDKLIYFRYYDGDLEVVAAAPTMLGEWHHYVMTTDGTPDAIGTTFYRDRSALQVLASVNGSGTSIDDSGSPMVVANSNFQSQAIRGLLDDVRIYDRVLTAEELARL